MTIEVRMEILGMTKENYEAINSQLGPKVNVADGFIAHLAGPIDGGYRVVELWQTQEAYGRFVEEVLLPVAQKAGLPAIHPQVLTVDNLVISSERSWAGRS